MSVFELGTSIGVRCAARALCNGVNMALLTEGGSASQRVYKHGPPNGGRPPIIDLRQAIRLSRVPLLITPVERSIARFADSYELECSPDQVHA